MAHLVRLAGAVLISATVVLTGGQSSEAVATAGTPVLVSRADEVHATAGWDRTQTVEYLAFTRRDPRTGETSAFLRTIRPDGSVATIRLNRSGDGEVGGFFFGPRVFYARATRGRNDGDWDVRVYDIRSGARSSLRGINTGKNEYYATRSNGRLLFNRDDFEDVTTRVILHDLRKTTHAETLLVKTTSPDAFAYAGQVSGNWAVWTRCNPVCDAYKRDIAAGLTTQLPKPVSDPALEQADPSVTSDGTVYLLRSGANPCSSGADIVRFGAADPAEGMVIEQLPPSSFATITYARSKRDGSVDVFFTRGNCATLRSDIYKVTDPSGP